LPIQAVWTILKDKYSYKRENSYGWACEQL